MESPDPIVEEIRAIRDAIAKACDYDIDRLAREMRQHQAASHRTVVRLPPKRAEKQKKAG